MSPTLFGEAGLVRGGLGAFGQVLMDQSACALFGSLFPFEPPWPYGARSEKWISP